MRSSITVVLNWNKAYQTIQVIETLMRFESEISRFMIIDNGSVENERNELIRFASKMSWKLIMQSCIELLHMNTQDITDYADSDLLVLLDGNYGYAKGNNFGLQLASDLGYKFVAIANNDVLINKDVLSPLIKTLSNDSTIACVGPKVIDQRERQDGPYRMPNIYRCIVCNVCPPVGFLLEKYERNTINSNPHARIWVSGCFFVGRLSALQEIGYFDPGTFLYEEEVILSHKLYEIGYRVAYCPTVMIKHVHASQGRYSTLVKSYSEQFFSIKYYFEKYRRPNKLSIILYAISYRVRVLVWIPILVGIKRLRSIMQE